MDISQALKDAENALRDFISLVLEEKGGSDWASESGVSADRVSRWRERQAEDIKRLPTGTPDARLIYYADFYDLKTILKKHWADHFKAAFDDLKTTEVFLDQLESFRNPDAHRRELLPHQKHLVIGISGYIRNRISRYRSRIESSDSYYPRLESVTDSYGNSWLPSRMHNLPSTCDTGTRLRVGDNLELIVAATDPEGQNVQYAVQIISRSFHEVWQDDNVLGITIDEGDVAKVFVLRVRIRSQRQFYAKGSYDDEVSFMYEVLPPQ